MNIKSKIVKGIIGLEMIASLGACKTVMMNGYSVTCSPFENYPSDHQCYEEPSKSSSSSTNNDHLDWIERSSVRAAIREAREIRKGHYEGCR